MSPSNANRQQTYAEVVADRDDLQERVADLEASIRGIRAALPEHYPRRRS